ncbi:MAG: hypothetical protein QNL80_14655 [Akkermansiaceae bacterium]
MTTPQQAMPPAAPQKKKNGCLIALAVIGVIGVLTIGGCVLMGGLFVKGVSDAVESSNKETQDKIASLKSASPSSLSPSGDLESQFGLMSEYTDIQRENAKKEITGKIVQWTLEVYEVSKSSDYYRIQTSGSNAVGTFISLYPQSDEESSYIESLKTGDTVTVKGYITGTTMRNVDIDPAILVK